MGNAKIIVKLLQDYCLKDVSISISNFDHFIFHLYGVGRHIMLWDRVEGILRPDYRKLIRLTRIRTISSLDFFTWFLSRISFRSSSPFFKRNKEGSTGKFEWNWVWKFYGDFRIFFDYGQMVDVSERLIGHLRDFLWRRWISVLQFKMKKIVNYFTQRPWIFSFCQLV